MVDLGSLGGTDSFSLAVSKQGQIIGVYNLADDVQRGFSWTAKSGMVDIGTLGGSGARPLAVNGAGQVAGTSSTARQEQHAFLWRPGQPMADLNGRLVNAPAGLVLDAALALSDGGSIVAGSNAGPVLLRPVGLELHPAPVVGPIDAPAVIKPGSAMAVNLAFNDSDSADLHHADWQWGDVSMETALVTEQGGAGSARGVHVYREAGNYTIIARVTDRAGNTTTVKRDVVVADPAHNATLGRGRVTSPQGALRADPAQCGEARFTMVAPADGKQSAAAPAGLQFATGKAVFASTSMVRASTGATAPGLQRYTGTGRFNGKAGYQYSLTVAAAPAAGAGSTAAAGTGQVQGAGQFGLRIWHTAPAGDRQIVDYDNQARSGASGAKVVDGAIAVAM
jgi:probable HAF family extracellular repeat protein